MSNWIKEYFQLPDNWKLEKLKDLTHLIIDGTHHTPTYVEHGVPFLRVTDVQSKDIDKSRLKYVTQKEHKYLIKRCNPEKGDILYSKNGSIGIPKIVDWDWQFSIFVSLALIKLRKGINPVYVKFLLQSDLIKKQIYRRAKQGTVINLHLEEIRELELPRSSIVQEKKIAHILTTLDNVIEKTAAAIAKYEAIKQGMMHDLFTRGIGADGQLRPTYADAPELYKESALGWIPREWEVETIESISKSLGDAPFGSMLKSVDYRNKGIPVIQGNNVKNFNFYWINKLYTSSEKFNSLRRSHASVGDLVFPKIGTIGGCAILPKVEEYDTVLLSTNMMKVDISPRISSNIFILNYFNFIFYSNYISKISKEW